MRYEFVTKKLLRQKLETGEIEMMIKCLKLFARNLIFGKILMIVLPVCNGMRMPIIRKIKLVPLDF